MRLVSPLTPASTTTTELRERVSSWLAGVAGDVVVISGAVVATVDAGRIREALFALRDTADAEFDVLCHVTAVDRHPRDPRFDVVYELYSLTHRHRVRVKCGLADTGSEEVLPQIDSVSDIYLAANWHERETFDLMGIKFANHPDPRRILLPDRWDGHPLRRDYPFDGKRVWKVGTSVADGVEGDSNLGL